VRKGIRREAGRMAGWIDRWRSATVALGCVQEAERRARSGRVSRKSFFAVVGTGVLFSIHGTRRPMSWLVTAKHVFADPVKGWRPSTLDMVFPDSHR